MGRVYYLNDETEYCSAHNTCKLAWDHGWTVKKCFKNAVILEHIFLNLYFTYNKLLL